MSGRTISLFSLILLLGLAGVSTAEMVGYWPLDGDALDAGQNGFNGTIVGEVVPTEDRDSNLDAAMLFTGASDCYIDLGDQEEFRIAGAMTLAAWVRLDSTNTNNGRIVAKQAGGGSRSWSLNIEANSGGVDNPGTFHVASDGNTIVAINDQDPLPTDEWVHIAGVYKPGIALELFIDGELKIRETSDVPATQHSNNGNSVLIGNRHAASDCGWMGAIDEVRIYNNALSAREIKLLALRLKAHNPEPKNGAIYEDTWVTLSWNPGGFAVSHDVYLGDTFSDVNEATQDSNSFRGNQTGEFILAGFFGYPYPDGLTPGTTYYWRIDEVNDAEPNSPWKGNVWSFTVPPKTAYNPVPSDGNESIDLNVQLSWTAGFGAKFHYIIFGEDFDEVNNTAAGFPIGTTNYKPGPLKLAKTYYWRVDESDGFETAKGEVWSFTTEGAVSGPNPADGAEDISATKILIWVAGAVAASHDVYFGTDADTVANATKTSSEYKGSKALGEESYDPGKLMLNTTYFWRIDEANDANPDSPWAGNVWSFTTGNYLVIDDFEGYDAGENQIWYTWHDGLGYGTPDTADYYAGNGTGAAVGDETTTSYTEETIVHGGNQSMPLAYNNNKQGYAYYSEAELTLTAQRDWTVEGVAELSIWFRGIPASVGSFIEDPVGTYAMTATGEDIWYAADQFHYAFKMLNGTGSIVAQVLSVDNTNQWAKAGVMIRETLDPGSKFAAVYITPGNGCRFQARDDTGIDATSDTSVVTSEQTAITAPYWVKLERDIAGNFRGYYSADGSNWTAMSWNPQFISMNSDVYIGLAITAHNAAATCEAKFSNVIISGTAGAQWMNQDIGILSNATEPLYVALSNSTGTPAVVAHNDPAAATIDTWTEWVIPLSAFADQGIVLTDVDKIAIGLGTRGNTTAPGGSGKMYIDDIRLYLPGVTP
jgi:hypothetical protein